MTREVSRRTRVGRACACVSVLGVTATAAVWLYNAPEPRQHVECVLEQLPGYRIEYSVSKQYTKNLNRLETGPNIVVWEFTLPTPPKWRFWLDAHIMDRPLPALPWYPPVGVIIASAQRAQPDHASHYYTWTLASQPGLLIASGTSEEDKQLVVSGCAANWQVSKWTFKQAAYANRILRSYTLTIRPPHGPVQYTFYGSAEGAADQARLRSEMIAIRDSIEVIRPVK